MPTFAVWAPAKKSMELLVEGHLLAMDRHANGWWAVEASDHGPGSDYLFRIDQSETCPDPRSNFQPQGVHGPSRVVDHQSFQWTDRLFQARPLSSALIYELHVGTFTAAGTFEAAIEKLAHLLQLGVTHIELMPVVE